jgi:DNA-binding PadR family transcriptional regulator
MERELLLLGLLRREDMHGYQLHEFINGNMASCTDMKKPTAYYLLDKMAERGWIVVTKEEPLETNRPPRRVYQITPTGEAAFQKLLRENLAVYHSATFAGNIGLAFMDALPASESHALLNQRRDILAAELEVMQSAPYHGGMMQVVIDHQVHHLSAELSWLDSVLARLSSQ